MYILLSGAIMLGCWVIAMFFYKFWKQTNDRLFQTFSFVFCIFGFERILTIFPNLPIGMRTFTYFIRFLASALILAAIVNKNRSLKRG